MIGWWIALALAVSHIIAVLLYAAKVRSLRRRLARSRRTLAAAWRRVDELNEAVEILDGMVLTNVTRVTNVTLPRRVKEPK